MHCFGKESQTAPNIRRAKINDAEILPATENSAGQVFRQIPDLAHLVDGEDHPPEWYRQVIGRGVSWVAVDQKDRPVGFSIAEIFSDELHIWELAVHAEWQRAGIGRRLLQHSLDDAKSQSLASVTLTTFRGVPWNEPFYARLGFITLQPGEIGSRLEEILKTEIKRGWPRRCAMRLLIK